VRRKILGGFSARAWAIETGPLGGFIGVYRFSLAVPPYFAGQPICLWKSRRDAREALSHVKGLSLFGKYPRARVVRVGVTITTLEEKP
jgi:hypothetical protein